MVSPKPLTCSEYSITICLQCERTLVSGN
uniref:1-aminocyclopropane-1-carboxylate oxidase homolog 1-like n=1 Tax=Rhizophora mucronata TaxID=61149 RepID=A0A2P2KWD7_RHIMU